MQPGVAILEPLSFRSNKMLREKQAVALRWFPTFCLRKTKRNIRANKFVDRLLRLIVTAGAHA